MKSHKQIFEYWRDKGITKDGKVVTYESDLVDDIIDVVGYWCKPMCWACGEPIISKYEKSLNKVGYTADELDKMWGEKKVLSALNRCHIKPKQFGGEDTVDNLFLMCEQCHHESPDTNNREAFMRWVYNKRKDTFMGDASINNYLKLVDEELNARHLPNILTMCHMFPNMNFDNLKEFYANNLGTHGSKASLSSKVIVLADYFENKMREMLDKVA